MTTFGFVSQPPLWRGALRSLALCLLFPYYDGYDQRFDDLAGYRNGRLGVVTKDANEFFEA